MQFVDKNLRDVQVMLQYNLTDMLGDVFAWMLLQ